jgi:thioredoxin reductase/SAM-dependent methyltransferase
MDPDASIRVDVAIVGGGPAGLAAATMLARVRRSVAVIDAGRPRNAATAQMHAYPTRDGVSPQEFLAIARREAEGYGATTIEDEAVTLSPLDDGFAVTTVGGLHVRAGHVLLASGLADELPDVPGLAERWGIDVIHCPYCHGWEFRDRAIVVIGTGPASVHQAQLFRQLSGHVTLVTHDMAGLDATTGEALSARAIAVVEDRAARIVRDADAGISGVALASGDVLGAEAVVVASRMEPHWELLAQVGIEPVEYPSGVARLVPADEFGATSVDGVWVAGNVGDPMHQVLHAAASGAKTAAMINVALTSADVAAATERHAATRAFPVMDRSFWEERYGSADAIWSGNPNPHLVTDIGGVDPGRALDVGAGEGADATWLAEQGWHVTAVDVSSTALERGRRQAESQGAIAERIEWWQRDVTSWTPPRASFDLVTMHFMHPPPPLRQRILLGCARAVAPGGLLLVVGHSPRDLDTGAHRAPFPDLYYDAAQVTTSLGDGWEVLSDADRAREVTIDDRPVTLHDTVVLARRLS